MSTCKINFTLEDARKWIENSIPGVKAWETKWMESHQGVGPLKIEHVIMVDCGDNDPFEINARIKRAKGFKSEVITELMPGRTWRYLVMVSVVSDIDE